MYSRRPVVSIFVGAMLAVGSVSLHAAPLVINTYFPFFEHNAISGLGGSGFDSSLPIPFDTNPLAADLVVNGFSAHPYDPYYPGSPSFSYNDFDGLLFRTPYNLTISGGRFLQNKNAGVQVISSNANVVDVSGGAFEGNLVGLDVYNASLHVSGGSFSSNTAYGLTAHSLTNIDGGVFANNGDVDLIAFGTSAQVNVHGGKFSAVTPKIANFAAASGSSITLFGAFDKYGTFADVGSFAGVLKNETTAQSFTYSTWDGGSITLSPVPENSALVLMLAGLLALCVVGKIRRETDSNH